MDFYYCKNKIEKNKMYQIYLSISCCNLAVREYINICIYIYSACGLDVSAWVFEIYYKHQIYDSIYNLCIA